ncbi:DUF1000-domain-containing protein [Whalleya microplaca]|nr:DUF1000-domain-containing protein [Whalleya microplaca]
MSRCRDEHAGHGGHGHDHDHEHDHSDDITPALQHNLYQHIKFDYINTFNETRTNSGKAIVKKTWAERLEPEPELVSDADEQIIMTIPFTGQVKLHSIILRTSASASAPRTLKVFINRQDLDFTTAADRTATQTLQLSQTSEIQEIPVKRALFARVQSLALFFVDNFSTHVGDSDDSDSAQDEEAESTRLSYLAFKGQWMALGRAPAQILYEAAPNPNDHALKGVGENVLGSHVGGVGLGRGGGR